MGGLTKRLRASKAHWHFIQILPKHITIWAMSYAIIKSSMTRSPASALLWKSTQSMPPRTTTWAMYSGNSGNLNRRSRHRRALIFNLDVADVHNNLGIALRDNGQPGAAIKSYQRALSLTPNYAQAYNNLGVALRDLRQLDNSAASSRRALEILSSLRADAHYNFGVSLHNLGLVADAVASYRQATLKPDFLEAHNNLGSALSDQGQLEAAVVSYRRALEIHAHFAAAHSNLLFALNYLPEQPGPDIVSGSEAIRRPPALRAKPHTDWHNPPDQRQLRVGLVSSDLRDHPVGHFIEGVLAALTSDSRAKMDLIAYHNHESGKAMPAQLTEAHQGLLPKLV